MDLTTYIGAFYFQNNGHALGMVDDIVFTTLIIQNWRCPKLGVLQNHPIEILTVREKRTLIFIRVVVAHLWLNPCENPHVHNSF